MVAYQQEELTETAAIERVEREGFSDVVPRFHTVNGGLIPLRFYETTASGLVLTAACLSIFQGSPQKALRAEAQSRWDLLEAAFTLHLPVEVLGTDEHMRLTDDRLRTHRHHRHASGPPMAIRTASAFIATSPSQAH